MRGEGGTGRRPLARRKATSAGRSAPEGRARNVGNKEVAREGATAGPALTAHASPPELVVSNCLNCGHDLTRNDCKGDVCPWCGQP